MKLRYKITGGILIVLAVAIGSLGLVLSHNADCGTAPEVSASSVTMKAIKYRCYGSPDVLDLDIVEKPVPGDNEILVKVHAASVNPYDWHFMRGSPYFMRLMSGLGAPEDSSIGVDFAGTIESVGKLVTRFKAGDEIFGGGSGAFAEYLLIGDARSVTMKPSSVTFEQAASMPIAAVTALQALRDLGKLRPGQKVLINGASGGVGTFAVQIARSLGAEVTGVCSTRNQEMVKAIGADHVLDYTKEDYTTIGNRYDLIVDMVGNHSLSANRKALTPDGILVIVGGAKGDWLGPLMRPINALILSPFVGQDFKMLLADINAEDLTILGELIQTGELTPVIDRRYELRDVPAAIRYSEEGHARGKIIVTVQ